TFEASLDHVFGMWTQPEHFFVWLPPKDAKIKFYNGEIKTGSETFYCMEGSFGTLYGKSNYLGVLPNKRIVYTQQFCDEDQNIIRHPMAPTWPETMQCTVLFESEDALLTRVTVVSQVYGNASEEERDTFFQAKSDMTQGWTGSFDKLEKYLLE
ncbi:MAG: SRPBCC domain-containing protein, partial [Bdellovibrionales bacterium]|nr:SRPBCC domain-containing protein [Bdellovibrionales bacterium]